MLTKASDTPSMAANELTYLRSAAKSSFRTKIALCLGERSLPTKKETKHFKESADPSLDKPSMATGYTQVKTNKISSNKPTCFSIETPAKCSNEAAKTSPVPPFTIHLRFLSLSFAQFLILPINSLHLFESLL
uniref:Uncharacterized protein n=1 Tax=Cucumis sativus TaxID=3659 RepID=A0A0A0L7L9_CUCSA